ncbi:hypothetical protein BKA66DRAFT_469616 [Pyrenochaeta sp. MPI-SDFR-AT-0127]|nr:hypothetical protein BKA66DRAFT_469616 [Pyrenochaeta sp. MPI-SDFR-AT-0127]
MSDKDEISPASTSATCVTSFSRSSTANDQVWTQISPPFERKHQLCKDLQYIRELEKPSCLRSHDSAQTLPDAPRVRLNCPSQLLEYCLEDLDTPNLNKLGEKLWWVGPTPDIVSLSQQTVLERRIQVTEDPSVHLCWADGVVYVKPLPAYLASFDFWVYVLDTSNSDMNPEERDRLKVTALGFLKSYASLIQRRSDFNLARRHELLASFENLSFEAFITFISCFDAIPDSTVSSRWRYGLLQLDELNFHSAIHLRRLHLNRFESRYGAYFQRFFPAILFIFALLSVMLSAMQVILGARQLWDTDNKGLKRTLSIFEWASCEAIGWSLSFGILLLLWWIGISAAEALKKRKVQKKVRKRLKEERVNRP